MPDYSRSNRIGRLWKAQNQAVDRVLPSGGDPFFGYHRYMRITIVDMRRVRVDSAGNRETVTWPIQLR
jgi:hypothetical protein